MLSYLILVCLLVSSGEAAPVGLGNGADGVDDPPSNLLSIVESFKGENPMQTLSNFMKEYKVLTNVINKFMLMSPLYKNMIDQAAKQNAKLRLVLKLAKGEVPDLHDLYDLLRHRKTSLSQELSAVYNSNRKKQTLNSIIDEKNSILDSTQDVQTFYDIFADTNVTFDPNLVAEIRKKIYKPTSANIAEYNAVILISCVQANLKQLASMITALTDGSTAYLHLLKQVVGLDFSLLSRIKVIQPQLNNSKYSVSSPEALLTDPDAVQILQDRQKAQQLLSETSPDQTQGEMLISDMLNRAVNLAYRDIQALKASQGMGAKSSQEKPSFG